ncbi:uncharacterized protein LOC126843409 [Adelges cooleyi]|uniref:uncharacterized protein LOC126843409 n=1 Tax=Adelges cooleyi TaxID=133065 RepID=UPI00217FC248|nr:uncharacterized protein LOC126843409 [Adelges cooleyi]XP_050436908.1 uncharacterized protein LOC126843409 [Adelges cooleyi]
MEFDYLEEMPEDKMDYFCDKVLKKDWPNSINVYYFIKTGFKWNNKNAASTYKLYYVPNDIDNGTFLGIYHQPGGKHPTIFVPYTSPGNEQQLQTVLRNTKVINWQTKPYFQAVLERITGIVESTIRLKCSNEYSYAPCIIHWMPANEAANLELKVPEDVIIGPLNKDHVDFTYSHWTHGDVYSKYDVWDTINLNFGLGVFDRQNNDLLAWGMCGSYGGVTTVMVLPKCRNNGYGVLIAKAVTKEMGERGISPHGIIDEDNVASLKMARKIGYRKSERVVFFEPR